MTTAGGADATERPSISAVIVARDEEDLLPGCLASLRGMDEIVVVIDSRTTDASADLARKAGANVFTHEFRDFSDIKNAGIAHAKSDWVLVIDADERLSPALQREIQLAVRRPFSGFDIRCENYFFGTRMRAGGWDRDWHVRLFRRDAARFRGAIHEELSLEGAGRVGRLKEPMIHLSHRSVRHNALKTLNFAEVQAAEMLARGHPPVTAKTLAGVVSREFVRRMIKGRAWRDGMAGVIEAFYQPFSLFVVYVRLWEMQQVPSLEDVYADIDSRL